MNPMYAAIFNMVQKVAPTALTGRFASGTLADGQEQQQMEALQPAGISVGQLPDGGVGLALALTGEASERMVILGGSVEAAAGETVIYSTANPAVRIVMTDTGIDVQVPNRENFTINGVRVAQRGDTDTNGDALT